MACDQAPIISAAGHTFILPREDLWPLGERFAGGLVIISTRPLADFLPTREAQDLII